jgi:hypothetical protein
MTGQAYSARSEPNYRNWAVAALVVGLIGSLWYAFKSPKEVPPQESAVSGKPGVESRARAAARRQENERIESLSSVAYRQALDSAGSRIRDLTEEIARFRRAEEARGAYFPPPSTDVQHIGYPILRQWANGWLVYGEWFNLGESPAAGYADVQMYSAGRRVGEVQSVRLGPIEPGGRLGYHMTFPDIPADSKELPDAGQSRLAAPVGHCCPPAQAAFSRPTRPCQPSEATI